MVAHFRLLHARWDLQNGPAVIVESRHFRDE